MTNETVPTLGEFLRQERERRGITIEQVASATKVSVRLLHFLESDNYTEMPATPFIRGFVNSYCRFVGLDSKEVLTRFGDYIESQAHERPARDAGHSGYAFERRDGEQSRIVLMIVLITFMVFGGLVYVFLKPSLHHGHSSHADKLKAAHPDEEPSPAVSGEAMLMASPGPSPSSSPDLGLGNIGTAVPPKPEGAAPAVPNVLDTLPLPPPVKPSPSPSVPPKPSPSPSPSPKPSPSPSPTPKPTPTATKAAAAPPSEPMAAGATGTVTTSTASTRDVNSGRVDKLNSGINLAPAEVHYKLVFKAQEHVWVRYQIDDRPMMKFILRKGSVLVLKARDLVHFQTSDAKAVSFSLNGGGYHTLANDKIVASRQADQAYILPPQDSGMIGNVFPNEKPILGASVPLPTHAE